ncbi:CDP-alcohol phosphatidyltransferase family protein [Spongiactinospora rosea]|uniref:CDP-alcohol phosphatidyltransferase family protein n=1 Tax=Spongiactinospora rosea TaxID=2248750 RepID=A0A366M2F7_9ACTN|nr:CDP-alcohol phosphatidyltransferase family protein [Spongiactinospora rosea]RBQ19950.1 CDP-alcohol phosphatidyltransferase family protein [Spongiactinospora rosea]
MTRVVLLGSSPGPNPPAHRPLLAALPGSPTVTGRLHGQLASLDPHPVTIVRADRARDHEGYPGTLVTTSDLAGDLRALADAVEDAQESLLILPADSLIHDELIYQITKSKRGALALVAKEPRELREGLAGENGDADDNGEGDDDRVPIDEAEPEISDRVYEGLPVRARVGKSRVISVGSAFHAVTRPNAVLLGPLHLHHKHAVTLAEAARELAGMAHLLGPEDDVIQLLVLCLVRRGVSVGIRGRRDLFFRRVSGQEAADEAVAEMAGFDEDRARLNNAVKGADGFFTTYFVSTYSRFIARWAARRGLTPNQVTLISIFLGVAAAAGFATGTRAGSVAGAVLIYFAFVFDCVDGQVARYARKFGVLGAWLDATFDRFKEYVVFAGLAIGAAVAGQGDVWTLALVALAVQSVRHLLDFSYGAASRRKPPSLLPTLDLAVSADTALRQKLAERKLSRQTGVRGLLRMWSRAGRVRAVHWARKMIVFPIGERFAAIAITAAFFEPRITFLTLVIWGSIAAAYTLTGRLVRSLA